MKNHARKRRYRRNLRSGPKYLECLEAISLRIMKDRANGEPAQDFVILHRNGIYRSVGWDLWRNSKRNKAGWIPVVVVSPDGELSDPRQRGWRSGTKHME